MRSLFFKVLTIVVTIMQLKRGLTFQISFSPYKKYRKIAIGKCKSGYPFLFSKEPFKKINYYGPSNKITKTFKKILFKTTKVFFYLLFIINSRICM